MLGKQGVWNYGARAGARRSDRIDRREDPCRQDEPGHRIRLHPNQGRAYRRYVQHDRGRRLRLGEPLGGWPVELLQGRDLEGPADRIRSHGPERGDRVRREAHPHRAHRLLRDDARLPRVRQGRRDAGAVPHLAEHQHLRGPQEAFRAVPVQHPGALVHRPPVPGGAQQGRARRQGRVLHHARRLRALEAHRQEGARRRRRLRHVPDRSDHPHLRNRIHREVQRAAGSRRAAVEALRPAAGTAGRRHPGRHADRRRRQAARPVRHPSAGHRARSA